MSEIRKQLIVEDSELDCGELSIVRGAGTGGKVVIKAKSQMIHDYFKMVSEGRTKEGKYGEMRFPAWEIPEELFNQFSRGGSFSVLNSVDGFSDEYNGNGPVMSFLRHTALGEGIEVPIQFPIGVNELANMVGDAFAAFLDFHLRPMKRTFKFTFTEV